MLLFKRIAFHVSAFDRCLGNFHQINHHEVGANAIEVADSPNPKTTSIRPFLIASTEGAEDAPVDVVDRLRSMNFCGSLMKSHGK